jgi:hypothetical protein
VSYGVVMRTRVALLLVVVLVVGGCSASDEPVPSASTTTLSMALESSTTDPTPRSYSTPREVIEAAEAAGFACESIYSIFETLDEPQGQASCDLADDEPLYTVMAFTTEEERLGGAIGGIVVGCGAMSDTSAPVVYVYGVDWMILGYNEFVAAEQGFGDVHALASGVGGSVNSVSCPELVESVLNIDSSRDWLDVLGELTVEELRGVLGEGGASYSPPTTEATTTTDASSDPDATFLTEPSASAALVPGASGAWAPGTLVSGADGSLWGSYQGTQEGLIFSIDPSGTVVEYGPFEAFPYLPNSMTVTSQGEAWFISHGLGGGMWRMADGAPEMYRVDPPLLDTSSSAITAASDGSIWGATDDADLVVYNGTQWSLFEAPPELREDGFVRTIAVAADGTVWIGRTDSDIGGLLMYDGEWTIVNGPDGLPLSGVIDLAIGTNNSVFALVDTDYVTETPGTLIHITDDGVSARVPGAVFRSPASLTVQPDGRWVVLDQNHGTDVELYYGDGESITRRRLITDLSAASVIGAEIATTESDTWVLVGALLSQGANPGWAEPTPPESTE